jgi:hypothetical protein
MVLMEQNIFLIQQLKGNLITSIILFNFNMICDGESQARVLYWFNSESGMECYCD